MTSVGYNPGYGVTSPYNRVRVVEGVTGIHYGTDYGAISGSPIPAASTGVVVYSGLNNSDLTKGLGYVVVVKSTGTLGTYYTLYGHMTGVDMPVVGNAVSKGTTIGRVGSTGHSTGPHIHFELLNGDAPFSRKSN